MTEKSTIVEIARLFEAKLRRLHEKMDFPSHRMSHIELRVNFSREQSKFELEIQTGDYPYVTVKGSELGVLMDEVYRRLNYEDQEKARIEASLTALPAPADDEIPF